VEVGRVSLANARRLIVGQR